MPSLGLAVRLPPIGASDNDDVGLSMFEDPVGHLTLKNIFLSESKSNNDDDDDDDDDEDDNDEPTLARVHSTLNSKQGWVSLQCQIEVHSCWQH